MRTSVLFILIMLVSAISCVKQGPSWKINWDNEPSREDSSGKKEEEKPQPGKDTTETPVEYELAASFCQTFDAPEPENFGFRLQQGRDDFRYFSAFPSLSERETDILLLRLDPGDAAGAAGGPRVAMDSLTFLGSYSVRAKMPDISRLKAKPDVTVEFGLSDKSAAKDDCCIFIRWKLSSLGTVIYGTRGGEKTAASPIRNFDSASGFYEYGFDWNANSLEWWIIDPGTRTRTVIGKTSDRSLILQTPAYISAGAFHTSAAPKYPFEIEIDSISYTSL